MRQTVNILGVPIDVVTMEQALGRLLQFLKEDRCHGVYTPNPEIVMAATRDSELMSVLKKADLVVPDGIGIVLATRLKSIKIKKRVPGYDMVQNLFEEIKHTNYTVYLLGAAPGVAADAAEKMRKKHKGLKIVGVHDGYFSQNEEKAIIDEINQLRPNILLVGFGAPKQEKWIAKYQNILKVKICIGVGGSIDIMSGKVQRAPVLFQKLGLEWFHRLMKQPTRAKRMIQLPIFVIAVLKEFFTGGKEDNK